MSKSSNIKIRRSYKFGEAFEAFQASNHARNLAKPTIENYNIGAKSLQALMGKNDFNLKEIDEKKIEEYIQFCRDRNNKPISINTRLRILRAMLNFFYERNYMDSVKIKLLKVETPVKETYTEAELKKLLKKPNLRKCGFDDIRTWAIENFLIGTGVRLSSLINIKVGDLHLKENEVIIRHVKTRQQLILPIASSLRAVLVEYLGFRKPQSDNDWLFPTWHDEQLTASGLKNSVRRYNANRGITLYSIHAFRHTYAKLCILSGMDAFRLMRLLGHKSIVMTQRYINLFSQDLKINYEEFNPLNNLTKSKQHIKIGQ